MGTKGRTSILSCREYRASWVNLAAHPRLPRQTLAEFAESYGRPEQESPDWEQHLTVDAEPWGADTAYQLSLGGEEKPRFILCYGMRIVEIDFDWEPDAAAKALVGQTLGG